MDQLEQDTRRYLRASYGAKPSIEVVPAPANLVDILAYARSRGWIDFSDGMEITPKGIAEVINVTR